MERETVLVERFFWVDALRGLAAVAIVVFHYHHFYLADAFGRGDLPPVESFPYATLLKPLYGPWAANAVELFWLISGFVFAHVYTHRAATAWEFGVARFARLYPLHLATLLYVAGLQWVSLAQAGHWQVYGNNDPWHFILQLFMASNWPTFSWGLSFNGPIWSVSLEVLVYCGFFLCLGLLRQAPLLASAVLCALCWCWFWWQTEPTFYLSRGVFRCAGYFFLGATLYALRPHAGLARAGLLAAVGAAAAVVGSVYAAEQWIVVGVSVAVLSLFAAMDRVAPMAGERLSALGDISYSLYLVHVPLQMTVLLLADLAFSGTRAFSDSPLTLPLYLLASILTAHAAYRWFERPVGTQIRRRLLRVS